MAMSPGEEALQVRAAKNQSFFREVNERVDAVIAGATVIAPIEYRVCECAQLSCNESMAMTVAEYEAVREHPSRFAVLEGHVVPLAERVVGGAPDRFVVVEKTGAGGTYAAKHDPRSGSHVSD
jgi:hypothetical protein